MALRRDLRSHGCAPAIIRFSDDETVVAYQFIRSWKDKDNKPIVNRKGDQIKSASPPELAAPSTPDRPAAG